MTFSWEIAALSVAAGTLIFLVLNRRRRRHIELIEDALKHLYNCEYTKVSCTLESLSGALGYGREQAAAVVSELTRSKFITLEGSELKLTSSGREYALKVIRVHRLWERHLADETMVQEVDWHKQAEAKEHSLKQEQVSELSRRLGHPVYDPHGDPIPGADGSIPAVRGIPLQTFNKNAVVTITHVEDEPTSVYAQLVQRGLYPGMNLRVLDKLSDSLVIQKEGIVFEIPLIVAANVRAVPEQRKKDTGPQKTLATLRPGEEGIVSGISHGCRGLQRRRLMDLGIVPGTTVGAVMTSVSGDPTAYRIRGGVIALRKEQAEMVFLQ
ncbi:MAG: metal-dependent transcriptional regulator [Ignavibacteriales bacterium]|nr:metal-dependent transcriptional regulator [Ignavibacteriales bacterium]